MQDDDYRMYVFVRNDLDSLSVGKIAAQVHHTATHFMYFNRFLLDTDPFKTWLQSGGGFGTVLTMNGGDTPEEFFSKLDFYMDRYKDGKAIGGIVKDPTYPVRDGKTTHLINLITSFYVFTNEKLEEEKLL